jgi:hypothetical protein
VAAVPAQLAGLCVWPPASNRPLVSPLAMAEASPTSTTSQTRLATGGRLSVSVPTRLVRIIKNREGYRLVGNPIAGYWKYLAGYPVKLRKPDIRLDIRHTVTCFHQRQNILKTSELQ